MNKLPFTAMHVSGKRSFPYARNAAGAAASAELRMGDPVVLLQRADVRAVMVRLKDLKWWQLILVKLARLA